MHPLPTNHILIWIFKKHEKSKPTRVYSGLHDGARKYNSLSAAALNNARCHGGMWQEVTQHSLLQQDTASDI